MPPYKQVAPLQEITLSTLALTLSSAIAALANGTYESYKGGSGKKALLIVPSKETHRIKQYIWPNIPPPLRTQILHRVLKNVVSTILGPLKKKIAFNSRVTMLNDAISYTFSVMINDGIVYLDMTDMLHVAMKWIDTCRFNNMSSNISYSKIEEIFLKNLAQSAHNMSDIVWFKWPHLISGDLLRIIGKHFKHLKELLLACSCEMGPFIEEERKHQATHASPEQDLIPSLEALFCRAPGDYTNSKPTGCPELRNLTLPHLSDEQGKAATIMAKALVKLPNLQFVTGPSILVTLLKFHNKHKSPLKLTHLYDLDPMKKRLMSEVSFLQDIVPDIQSIDIKVSKDLTRRLLNTFPHIIKATVEWPDFHLYAKNFGGLVSLNICLAFQSPWPLLVALGRSCTSLQFLTLERCTFQMDSQSLRDPKPMCLQSLVYLKLVQSSFVEFIAFKMLIVGCANLTEIYVTLSNDRNYMVDEFNDHLIKAAAPYLKNLRKFTVECLYKTNLCMHLNCLLTMTSFYSLLKHCCQLTHIGHLDSWDVKDQEVKEALALLRKRNWNLQIL